MALSKQASGEELLELDWWSFKQNTLASSLRIKEQNLTQHTINSSTEILELCLLGARERGSMVKALLRITQGPFLKPT